MRKYLLTVDLGFLENLAFILCNTKTKEVIYKKVYPLLPPNRSLTREKDKQEFWHEQNVLIGDILGEVFHWVSPSSSAIKLEAQISNRKWGRQLTLLEGIIMGQAFSLGFQVLKSRRNLDLCKKYNIPASRKVITTLEKKKKTIEKVNLEWPEISLDPLDEDSKHLCDAALLALEEF